MAIDPDPGRGIPQSSGHLLLSTAGSQRDLRQCTRRYTGHPRESWIACLDDEKMTRVAADAHILRVRGTRADDTGHLSALLTLGNALNQDTCGDIVWLPGERGMNRSKPLIHPGDTELPLLDSSARPRNDARSMCPRNGRACLSLDLFRHPRADPAQVSREGVRVTGDDRHRQRRGHSLRPGVSHRRPIRDRNVR